MTVTGRKTVYAIPVDAGQAIDSVADIMPDKQMFRQILVNLFMNSLTASSPGKSIMIRLTHHGHHAVGGGHP